LTPGNETGARYPLPLLLAWVLVAAVAALPHLRAHFSAPPGTRFVGTFYFVDDAYNYLSYVQQAEDGRFFFVNKLVREEHAGALVNLEWWTVGRLSALLGRRPWLAYRIVGVLASLVLLWAADLWLRGCGLPQTHRIAASLLVGLGGGLGGVCFETGLLPLHRCIDLTAGLYPFVEMLSNPHFVLGTALFLLALHAFRTARTWRGQAGAVALGSALALVRPYDALLLGAVRGLAVLVTERPRLWPARLLPLLGLAPAGAYNYWLLFRNPAFAFLGQAPYPFPPATEMAVALGPAAAGAVLGAFGPRPGAEANARSHLLAWAAMTVAIAVARPFQFPLQFLVGVGLPLLGLTSLGLARFRPAVTLLAAVALSGTAVAAIRLVLGPNPHWYVPAARMDVARALRPACRPGDVALAAPDIGLYLGGLTPCKAYLSHPIAPGYVERDAEARAFYSTWDPGTRAAFLDRRCITHLVLPGDEAPAPRALLGEGTPFRLTATTGPAPYALSAYSRPRPDCSPR
jgi:hypothetical protein